MSGAPVATATTPTTTTTTTTTRRSSSNARRRSKHLSMGRWDWSYGDGAVATATDRAPLVGNERKDADADADADAADDAGAPPHEISFPVVKLAGPRKLSRELTIDLDERVVWMVSHRSVFRQTRGRAFTCAGVQRMDPVGETGLRVRALLTRASGAKKWERTVRFESRMARDEFVRLVRGVNACAALAADLFERVAVLPSPVGAPTSGGPDKPPQAQTQTQTGGLTLASLRRAARRVEGASIPATEDFESRVAASLPETTMVSATLFFRWFVAMSAAALEPVPNGAQTPTHSTATSALTMADRIEAFFRDVGVGGGADEPDVVPPRTPQKKRSGASSATGGGGGAVSSLASVIPNAHGPLIVEPRLLPGESITLVENMVSHVLPIADGSESRRVVGALVVTDYRLVFAAYASFLAPKRGQPQPMDGVVGLLSSAQVLTAAGAALAAATLAAPATTPVASSSHKMQWGENTSDRDRDTDDADSEVGAATTPAPPAAAAAAAAATATATATATTNPNASAAPARSSYSHSVGSLRGSSIAVPPSVVAAVDTPLDLRIALPSERFGRRPDIVFAAFDVPLASITKLKPGKGGAGTLELHTALGRSVLLQFHRDDSWVDQLLRTTLLPASQIGLSQAVASGAGAVPLPTTWDAPLTTSPSNGGVFSRAASARLVADGPLPDVFDATMEFTRQGLLASGGAFSLVKNAGYALSQTYPSQILVPHSASLTPAALEAIARFRSRARLPAVTWGHPTTKAVLARSSQPCAGIMQTRCAEDELLVSALRGPGPNGDGLDGLYVVDARGLPAVMGNQLARGKGAERPTDYGTASVLFMGIANIHTVRASHEKLVAACAPASVTEAESRWLSRVDASGWLAHLQSILSASARVAELLEIERASVLVHCSDGWDRTAQICSLAQVMLDPYFRTLRGLAVLVEKDWVSFGFKFADRCLGQRGEEERSPIFVQFVDCLYQMWRQFPRHFEWNEAALAALAEAPYSRRDATFSFNSERERAAAGVSPTSFWVRFVDNPRFRNRSFVPFEGVEGAAAALWPVTTPKKLVVWEALHLAGDPEARPHSSIAAAAAAVDDGAAV